MPSLHKSRHFLEVISKSRLCFNQVHGRHEGWFGLQALNCIKSCETSNTPPYADQLGHCWPVFVPDLSSTRSKSVA